MVSQAQMAKQKRLFFRLIERVYRLSENAVMDCAGSCNGTCETEMPETVLFLPYELEYIMEGLGLEKNPFLEIQLPSGRYGMMDCENLCPFLVPPDCAIRPFRPFDCRSFPLFPHFPPSTSAPLDFYVASYCPLKARLSPDYIESIVESWRILAPHLPPDWKELYNSVCHYQEKFPLPKS